MPKKTERENPLGFFSIHSVSKLQNNERGDPLVEKKFEKKSHSAEKNLKGAIWSRPVLYVTLETFLVQFLGPTGTIWRRSQNFVELLVELFWSLQLVLKKKTDEKP